MTRSNDEVGGWQQEVLEHFMMACMAGVGQGIDRDPHQEHWVEYLQHQAAERALAAHGLCEADAAPERFEAAMDAIEDIATTLHRAAPSGGHGVLSEAQVFLLFYLAALVHGGTLARDAAAGAVCDCWSACANRDPEGEEPTAFDVADAAADAPWPVTSPSPDSAEAWVAEIMETYRSSMDTPPLPLTSGRYRARPGSLLEAAVVLALASRGVVVPCHEVRDLIDAIFDMEADVKRRGPEWEQMQAIAPLSFAMYYLWVHLAIGCVDEAQAERVISACTVRLDDFPDPIKPTKSAKRPRRDGRSNRPR